MATNLKTEIAEMVAGGDGVHVFAEGKSYGVAFEFSEAMVRKMRGVPEAAFDKEQGFWMVPGASAAHLCEAVGDMRDFVRSNGVQVKDVAAGKLVIFDFDKSLNQLVGPVSGAAFNHEAGGWLVPADSKGLVSKDGQASYFDQAINSMRGLVIGIEKAKAGAMDLAAKGIVASGGSPSIFFPKKDHSYTGPIIAANAHFAAQLTGVEEDTKKTAFIAIHRQSDLGQQVFNGDDLRVDYGVDNSVKVRTTEVFRQQQQEREKLTALAAEKMDGATVFNASTKDGKEYNGKAIEVSTHFVLQHVGRDGFALHDRSKLKGDFAKGDSMDVKYKGGVGAVNEKVKGREMAGAER